MSYYSANAVPIVQDWSSAATFPGGYTWQTGYTRLDVFANGTDAVVQLLMDDDPAAHSFQNDISQEIVIPMGFHSIPMETARFIAVRFKIWSLSQITTTPGPGVNVHMRAFS